MLPFCLGDKPHNPPLSNWALFHIWLKILCMDIHLHKVFLIKCKGFTTGSQLPQACTNLIQSVKNTPFDPVFLVRNTDMFGLLWHIVSDLCKFAVVATLIWKPFILLNTKERCYPFVFREDDIFIFLWLNFLDWGVAKHHRCRRKFSYTKIMMTFHT